MSKYTINEFSVGDNVYHVTNTKLKMVVIEILKDLNEVTCRWMSADGQIHNASFLAEELGKKGDLGPGFQTRTVLP